MWVEKQKITVTQCLEKEIHLSGVFGNPYEFLFQSHQGH